MVDHAPLCSQRRLSRVCSYTLFPAAQAAVAQRQEPWLLAPLARANSGAMMLSRTRCNRPQALVLEYVPLGSLSELLSRGLCLPIEQVMPHTLTAPNPRILAPLVATRPDFPEKFCPRPPAQNLKLFELSTCKGFLQYHLHAVADFLESTALLVNL